MNRIPLWLRHALRTVLHLLFDAAAVEGSYCLAYAWRFDWAWWLKRFPMIGGRPEWGLYQHMLYAVVPLWLIIFWYSSHLYDTPWLTPPDRFLRILKGCVLGTVAALMATYIYERLAYSRMMMVMVFPISAVFVCASQMLVLWIDSVVSQYEAARPVLIVGGEMVAAEIKRRILRRHPGAEVRELRELPESGALDRALAELPYYELILLDSRMPRERILAAAEICDGRDVFFKMVPDLLELRLGEVQIDHSLGLPAYRIEHASMTRLNFASKRAVDLVFSLVALSIVGLPLLIIAALIRLDSPGPALYRQKRLGYKGRVFDVVKFRTMAINAEAKLQEVRDLNTQGAFFKAKEDPRVTRMGRVLRRFSLDEFPQFINVLKGEMSVVGPRPLAVATGELEKLEQEFGPAAKKRLNALPGITGLWQVSGRSDLSSAQRFALDLFYIEHWSLGVDLEIVLKTVPAMLFSKGAY